MKHEPEPVTTKVEMSSVECNDCDLPNHLDANGICIHCRVRPMRRNTVSEPSFWARLWDRGPVVVKD